MTWRVPHGGGLSLLSLQCPLYLCPELDAFEGDGRLLELGLAGAHQRSNAALALQLARTWLQRRGCRGKAGETGMGGVGPRCCPPGLSGVPVSPGVGELKDVPLDAKLVGRPVLPAPTFHPTDAMIQGAVRLRRDPPPCHVTGLGGGHAGLVPSAVEGAAQPVFDPSGGPGAGGGAWGSQPCPVPPLQVCGTRSGWAGLRCCPTAP